MPKMTQEEFTKSNLVAEMLDSLFTFKSGDLVVERTSFEHHKAELAANVGAYDKFSKMGAVIPRVVSERVLRECPGNTQVFYTCSTTMQQVDTGHQARSALQYAENELVPWSEVTAFYAQYKKDNQEQRAGK